jgi:hypothetical protein
MTERSCVQTPPLRWLRWLFLMFQTTFCPSFMTNEHADQDQSSPKKGFRPTKVSWPKKPQFFHYPWMTALLKIVQIRGNNFPWECFLKFLTKKLDHTNYYFEFPEHDIIFCLNIQTKFSQYSISENQIN